MSAVPSYWFGEIVAFVVSVSDRVFVSGVYADKIGVEAAEMLLRNIRHNGCVDEFLQDQVRHRPADITGLLLRHQNGNKTTRSL